MQPLLSKRLDLRVALLVSSVVFWNNRKPLSCLPTTLSIALLSNSAAWD
jgi:hypothetical protein